MRNILDATFSLRDIEIALALGYIDPEFGLTIGKFSRTEVPNGVVSLMSSFINTPADFKPFNVVPQELFISSSSISDVHDITIYYVDSNRDLKEKIVTLTGTVAASLGIDIYCIYRMRNLSSTSNVGTISVKDASTKIFCNMPIVSGISTNTSLTGVMSIPRGYIGLLIDYKFYPDKGTDIKGAIMTRLKGGVFSFRRALAAYENQAGTDGLYLTVEEEADIAPIGIAKTGGIVYLDYKLILLKKEYLGREFK